MQDTTTVDARPGVAHLRNVADWLAQHPDIPDNLDVSVTYRVAWHLNHRADWREPAKAIVDALPDVHWITTKYTDFQTIQAHGTGIGRVEVYLPLFDNAVKLPKVDLSDLLGREVSA